MVVGNGMIARKFADYEYDDRHIIFASGVSNSNNKIEQNFLRERQLLEKTALENPEKKLVYFSTCSVYDASMQSSKYVQHKLAMEELIQGSCDQYCIFRVSNPVGVTNNPNTVLNYFIKHIAAQIPFEVWKNASRNLIDLDDMYVLCKYMLSNFSAKNRCINIANPENYTVIDILNTIEKYADKIASYTTVDKESNPMINTDEIQPLFAALNIEFGIGYMLRLIQKYFSF